jgi:hypothetical protein
LTYRNEKLLADPVRLRQISERIPAGRWGDPIDFAGPVVFLASTASQYVTGELLVVDGVRIHYFYQSTGYFCLNENPSNRDGWAGSFLHTGLGKIGESGFIAPVDHKLKYQTDSPSVYKLRMFLNSSAVTPSPYLPTRYGARLPISGASGFERSCLFKVLFNGHCRRHYDN